MAFSLDLRDNRRFRSDAPVVMGIVNITPDSFFAGSRNLASADPMAAFTDEAAEALRERVMQMVQQGAGMIDVGACSTRPGAADVSAADELHRLEWALPIVKEAIGRVLAQADRAGERIVPVSVDTFRAGVAQACVERLGADIVNDVSGGTADPDMLPMVVAADVPYILMHLYPTELKLEYPDGVYAGVSTFFREQLDRLSALGWTEGQLARKVVLDPGFGFAKNLDENYELFGRLSRFKADYPQFPLLVGISRKSMIYKFLSTDAEHAQNGTTVLNTLALQAGTDILRVHDVQEAVEAVSIVGKVLPSAFAAHQVTDAFQVEAE
jgi:dihydropteroate synthase